MTTESEHKWIKTNNDVCGLLRMAHDALACSSLPPGRTWVGLSTYEFKFIASKYLLSREAGLEYFQEEIETKLKEKNT